MWGIFTKSTTILHRLTFSKSLAEHICSEDSRYEAKQVNFSIGKNLAVGETSRSGLYALMSKKGDYPLRISLIKEISQIHAEDDTRYLAEAWIEKDE